MKKFMSDKWNKIKTYYSYSKYKLPVLFALIGLVFLTAFPGTHYEQWYRVDSKFNALAVFGLMLLSLVQFVNAINISGKKSKRSEFVYTILFTVLNVFMIVLALLYILPYFQQGFKPMYITTVLIITLGIASFIVANVFAFVFLGYDTQKSLKELVEQASENNNA